MKHTSRSLIASLLLVSSLTATPVYAAMENWVDGGYAEELYQARTSGSVSHSPYTARTFDTSMYRTVEHILGPVPGITVTADIMQKDPKYAQEMMQRSAVAGIGNYIAMMYTNPPADLALWIRDTGQTLGFIPKQTFAQGPGIGFSGLAPLLPLWKAFRNIAYLLLAIVLVIIGFMVMFRKKIDPKTVITVQNALPHIIITLILITFSYAIVGFMIDLMYLAILLVLTIMSQAGIASNSIQSTMATGSLWDLISAMFPNQGLTLGRLAFEMTGGWSTVGASALITAILGALITWNPAGLLLGIAGAAVPSVLVTMILSIVLIFGFIRLFLLLLNSYIQVVLALILGPVQLLMDAIPGGVGFSSWIKNLFVNLLAFPITAIMFLLAMLFSKHAIQGNIWSPPYLLSTSASGTVISALFSLGILLTIPQVINAVKEALKSKPVLPIGGGGVFGIAATAGRLGFEEILRARQTRILQETMVHRDKPITTEGKELKP